MIKYLFSVLTSTVILMQLFVLFAFSSTKEPMDCNKHSGFPACSVCNDNVEKESLTINNKEKLLEIKGIIEDYLNSNAVEKLENDTVKFLQDILDDVNTKLELFKN